MNQFRTLLVLLFFGISAQITAQTWSRHNMLSAGYAYKNQNFGEIGFKLLFLKNDDILYRIGGSALLGHSSDQFIILPKIQGDLLFNFQKNADVFHSYYILAGIESTNKHIAPKIGVSLFGLMDFTAGYGFPIDKKQINKPVLKELNLGLTLNIPTSVFF